MKTLFSIFVAAVSVGSAAAGVADTVRVSEFGVRPGTYVNSVEGLQAAIDSCRSHPGSVLLFEKGRYDVWPEGAVRKEIYISNTSSQPVCPSK